MINVLVTGGNGQMGRCLDHIKSKHSSIKFLFLSKDKLDITIYKSLLNFIQEHEVDVIINCAAYTKVDKAEEEPANAKIINVLGVKNLIKISETFHIKLIHISTDYVFDGYSVNNLKEEDKTNPLGVYGKTKLEGENLVLDSNSEAIIIRTSWLFSPFGNNFVKTILKRSHLKQKISVINDQRGKPTYGIDLAETIIKLIHSSKSFKNKIYHFSNKGVTTWYDFAKSIIKLSGSKCDLAPIKTENYPLKGLRSKNLDLNTELIETTLNLQIPNWKDSLNECLKMIK